MYHNPGPRSTALQHMHSMHSPISHAQMITDHSKYQCTPYRETVMAVLMHTIDGKTTNPTYLIRLSAI